MVSYMKQFIHFINEIAVLILIVVEDGLVLKKDMIMSEINVSLNPYCSGQWSSTFSPQFLIFGISSLNPCCSGQ